MYGKCSIFLHWYSNIFVSLDQEHGTTSCMRVDKFIMRQCLYITKMSLFEECAAGSECKENDENSQSIGWPRCKRMYSILFYRPH